VGLDQADTGSHAPEDEIAHDVSVLARRAMNAAMSTVKPASAPVVDIRSAWYADHDRKHTELNRC
jgi:hypothetical protein